MTENIRAGEWNENTKEKVRLRLIIKSHWKKINSEKKPRVGLDIDAVFFKERKSHCEELEQNIEIDSD